MRNKPSIYDFFNFLHFMLNRMLKSPPAGGRVQVQDGNILYALFNSTLMVFNPLSPFTISMESLRSFSALLENCSPPYFKININN